jgi:ornithine cyclodeaminase/alanine dehydrogenase-like protein (mu-crystallin family)
MKEHSPHWWIMIPRTMTCNLGLALDDMATAPLVFKLAVEKGLGTSLLL